MSQTNWSQIEMLLLPLARHQARPKPRRRRSQAAEHAGVCFVAIKQIIRSAQKRRLLRSATAVGQWRERTVCYPVRTLPRAQCTLAGGQWSDARIRFPVAGLLIADAKPVKVQELAAARSALTSEPLLSLTRMTTSTSETTFVSAAQGASGRAFN